MSNKQIDTIDNLFLMCAIGGVAMYGADMILKYILLRDFVPALSEILSVSRDSSLFPFVTLGLIFRYIRFRKRTGDSVKDDSVRYTDEVRKLILGWNRVWLIPVIDLLRHAVNTMISSGGLRPFDLLNHVRTDDFIIVCLCTIWIGYTDSRVKNTIEKAPQ
ncbi:MAG: hypothetical protein IKD71_04895 [Solobacterium sp.]|nr:hypothetical protein [Solobacterium sp.]